MTPEQYKQWLADMKSAGLARSDAQCARMLGLSTSGHEKIKSMGSTVLRTALACAALLHGIKPYE